MEDTLTQLNTQATEDSSIVLNAHGPTFLSTQFGHVLWLGCVYCLVIYYVSAERTYERQAARALISGITIFHQSLKLLTHSLPSDGGACVSLSPWA